MAETGRFADGNQLDMEKLRVQAKHRWLSAAEICEILRNYQKFSVDSKPANMPRSGLFFLFDRKVVRFFRNDGHNWRKKRDGKTVKEAHKKLKVGSIDVLHCYSAHGEENENFQRCCYWMLEGEISHIVLVHYLEVKGNTTNVNHIKVAKGTTTYFHETEETMDTTSLNSDKASENDDDESDNYQGKFSAAPSADFITPAQADKVMVANNAGLTDKPLIDLNFPCWKEILKDCEDCAQGVGSQPFHPSFSSTQTDTLGNIPKQVHEILGELSSNRLGKGEELGSHLRGQGESQAWSNTTCVGTTSTQAVDVASDSIMDYTNEFTNCEIFKSKEALIQWTREVGRKNGFVIVIKRSDSGDGGQKARITFCCERGGQYRNTGKNKEDKKEKQLRNTSTKKCGCPFTLKGQKLDNDDSWMLKVVCGVHNHPATKPFEGRSYVGRLSKEETSLLIDMSKSMVRPKDILMTLKNRDANNASTIKQIYNARQRHNKAIEMAERSQMQQLLNRLLEYKYIEWHRSIDNTDIIKDLLWAHPVSLELLRAFPRVLIMDCAYKTNKYDLPLLEIVGVTSTNMTFVVAFAYLESEQEDNYTWVLERLRSVMDDNAMPTVILSDKELALMNAIEKVFPAAKHLLCRWHVSRNVMRNCEKLFAANDMWEKFIMSWNVVVFSSNEDEFTNHLNTLKQEFSSYPQAIEYVTNTWLNNYKERFVSAWTDKIMHFGNLTENRVGSSHSMLKKQLHSIQGNFETSWANIHYLLELQHTEIKASFEKSLTVVRDQFEFVEFKELCGFISIDALHMVLSESKRASSVGVDASKCGCIFRHTYGLPCAHEIAEFKRESHSIPLESIDPYWRKLDLVPVSKKQKAKLGYESVFDLIAKRIDESDNDTRVEILKKLSEIANMESEVRKERHDRPDSKGDTSARGDASVFELE